MPGQQLLAGQQTQQAALPWLWWHQEFPGTPDHVSAARHWVQGILPRCDALYDLVTIASELAANAVTHTRSGQPRGAFTVQVAWSADLARIVVGDSGSDEVPTVIHGSDGTGNRGLEVVEALASGWGIGGTADGRWIWADVPWAQPDGEPVDPASGQPTAAAETALMRSFPGSRVWFGLATRTWHALPPKETYLIEAPSPGAIHQMLTARYLRRSPPPAPAAPGAPQASRFAAAPVMPTPPGG